jgi:hypothetical protein
MLREAVPQSLLRETLRGNAPSVPAPVPQLRKIKVSLVFVASTRLLAGTRSTQGVKELPPAVMDEKRR